MRAFDFVVADSPAAARTLVREVPGSRFYAGGTTLIDLMKADVERPPRVVDISRLALAEIEQRGDVVRIGALTRMSDAAHDPLVADNFPAVSQALLAGASGQIRNAATIGGNLLQRTRCTYFREPRWRCNKREPGSGCDALDGFNRGHAVLGTSDSCIASYPGDLAVALIALGANVVIDAERGERTIALVDFYRLPGDRPERETALEEGELITAVELRAEPLHAHSAFLKLRDRASYEFALVSVACALQIEGECIAAARLALGGIATVPWRAYAAEDSLAGELASGNAYRHAAEIALEGARTREHNAFKVELARRAIVRALRTTAGGAA